jgi:hypothetical protein
MEKDDEELIKSEAQLPKNAIKVVMILKMKPTLLLDENNHIHAQKPY